MSLQTIVYDYSYIELQEVSRCVALVWQMLSQNKTCLIVVAGIPGAKGAIFLVP